MSWQEPACHHVLVLIMGQAPSTRWSSLSLAQRWLAKKPGTGIVIPALLPALPSSTLNHLPPWFRRLQRANWGGDPSLLATIILSEALQEERPSFFLSYRRSDTAALADQLFDKLTRAGATVYLDRFTNSPGRHFPSELAQELAEKNVLLVLESAGLAYSIWTMWEIAFARQFGLGRVALNVDGAPTIKGISTTNRLQVRRQANGELSNTDADNAVAWAMRQQPLAALSRSAFYEEVVRLAARARHTKATVKPVLGGLLEVSDRRGQPKALLFPAGRPGRIEDAHRLARSASGRTGLELMLAGQHQHVGPARREGLNWLGAATGIEPLDLFSCYWRIRSLV